MLKWNQTVEANYRRVGATIIDAFQPLETVVSEILAAVRQRSENHDIRPTSCPRPRDHATDPEMPVKDNQLQPF